MTLTPEEARFRLEDSGGSSFLCTCDRDPHEEWCPRTLEAWLLAQASPPEG